jgi:hypothetical protein
VLACATPAFAQAPGEVAPIAPAPAPAAKDPSTALALSLGFTASGTAMLLLGSSAHSSATEAIGFGMMYLGPATGHWYAGEVGGAGLALRALAVLGASTAVIIAVGDDGCEDDGPCTDHGALITGLLIASAGAWVGSTIYDIATAPSAARSWNRAHGVVFGPTAMLSRGRSVPGVAVGLRF